MSIELMLLAVDLNFLVFSIYLDDIMDQLFALFVVTVAAAESAIGLAILVITLRIRGTIAVEFRELGPAPSFEPTGVLEVQRSRAPNPLVAPLKHIRNTASCFIGFGKESK